VNGRGVAGADGGGKAWVLWDGECGFCRRCVAWAVRHDRANRLRPVPYQRAPSPPMTPRLRRACARAVHVVTPEGRVLRAGRAVLYLVGVSGWPEVVWLLGLPPLIWLIEIAYRIVAENRPLFGRFLLRDEPVDPVAIGEATVSPSR
jgi:predicted DCC family thiol-disulfide oxidoreductase YuxK